MAQRRRRRLAQEESQPAIEPLLTADSRAPREPLSTTVPSIDRQLLRRCLSPRLWKHVLAAIVLSAVSIGCLALIHYADVQQTSTQTSVGPETALRVADGLAGLMMLAAGQLALLIGWMRSRSEIDFRGRYRWWRWFALGITTWACLQITSTTEFVPSLLVQLVGTVTGPIQAARHTVVLVPVVAWSIWVLSRVIPDMSRYRPAQVLLTAACLGVTLRMLVVFGNWQGAASYLATAALLLAPSLLLCIALLLHARYVTYICNDPPVERLVSQPTAEASKVEDSAPVRIADDRLTPDPLTASPDQRSDDESSESANTASAARTGSSAEESVPAPQTASRTTASKKRKQRRNSRKAA